MLAVKHIKATGFTTPTVTTKQGRTHTASVACDMQKQFNKIHTKRMALIKENINKLTHIGTVEIQFITDTMKELDELHRKKINSFVAKTRPSSINSEAAETMQDVSVSSEETEDNIFKKD